MYFLLSILILLPTEFFLLLIMIWKDTLWAEQDVQNSWSSIMSLFYNFQYYPAEFHNLCFLVPLSVSCKLQNSLPVVI